ncbi:hypothetical protein [Rhizobium brockwellii]|uniref:hypothetical protein n=1 Tax=Rhizobium brockwellii TaxID=3019932 RepID=UPI00293DB118|nr:hypothetical protein [Rhizobium brockwellii]MDV4159322.1 hypothetical protein [Rhizobium brockwellii]
MSFSPATSYKIRYAPGIWEKMCVSVGAFDPEHYAILGGRLDDPFYVTDFMPMPPLLDSGGNYRSSSAAVTLNGPFIEYYLNTCLLPFGKYFLGVMHSHPGGMNSLSGGTPGSGHGDIPSMRAHLEAAARYGEPWHNFIAPIVNYPGPSPQVTTWVVRLDTPRPILAEAIWEISHQAPDVGATSVSKIDEILDLVRYRPDLVRALLQKSDVLKAFLRRRNARNEDESGHVLQQILKRRVQTNKAATQPEIMPSTENAGMIIPPFF